MSFLTSPDFNFIFVTKVDINMKRFCQYRPKSKRCITWFNRVCHDCRAQFPMNRVEQHANEGIMKSDNVLISAEECYSRIKRSAEYDSGKGFLTAEIWWKIPLVLLLCGSFLIVVILGCMLCQGLCNKLLKQSQPDECHEKKRRCRPFSTTLTKTSTGNSYKKVETNYGI